MILKFKLPKYYDIHIDNITGKVNVFSNSKHAKGRELKQRINNDGYLIINLNRKTYTIHSLVAKFILGERPTGLCINHIDGNKLNNKPDNLEYITISENTLHSIRNGMHICNRPELIGTYKDGRTRDKIKYKRDWYFQNRERILNKAKEWYIENKETILSKNKEKYNAKKRTANKTKATLL